MFNTLKSFKNKKKLRKRSETMVFLKGWRKRSLTISVKHVLVLNSKSIRRHKLMNTKNYYIKK